MREISCSDCHLVFIFRKSSILRISNRRVCPKSSMFTNFYLYVYILFIHIYTQRNFVFVVGFPQPVNKEINHIIFITTQKPSSSNAGRTVWFHRLVKLPPSEGMYTRMLRMSTYYVCICTCIYFLYNYLLFLCDLTCQLVMYEDLQNNFSKLPAQSVNYDK